MIGRGVTFSAPCGGLDCNGKVCDVFSSVRFVISRSSPYNNRARSRSAPLRIGLLGWDPLDKPISDWLYWSNVDAAVSRLSLPVLSVSYFIDQMRGRTRVCLLSYFCLWIGNKQKKAWLFTRGERGPKKEN